MATQRTRYVNTGSTPGGDGTTNATSGANRAYATMSEMEAAEDGDLVSADVFLVCYFTGSTADTTAVTFSGWTTDATRYIRLEAHPDHFHSGTLSTSLYRMEKADQCINVVDADYFEIYGLQFVTTGFTTTIGAVAFAENGFPSPGRVVCERCIFAYTGSPVDYTYPAQFSSNSRAEHFISNNFAYGLINDGAYPNRASSIYVGYNPIAWVQHNTVRDCAVGLAVSGRSNIRFANNLVIDWQDKPYEPDQTSGWATGTDYNQSDGTATLPGSNSSDGLTITFAGADDPHTSDVDAKVANNLYSDTDYPTTEDIDGAARPTTGDVYAGADETTSVAAEGGFFDLLGIVGFLAGASGTPGGVTLSVLTVSASVPGATATGKAATTLAALNLVSSAQTATATGKASTNLSALDVVSSVQATSETGAANVSLAALDVVSSAQATTETGAAVVSLTALDVVVSAQAPSTGVPGNVSLPVLTVAASVPGATATGQGTASLGALTVTAATQATSETGAAQVSLAALDVVSSVQATTETGAANTTLAALNVATSAQTATATSTAAGEVTLSVLTVSASLPGAAATGKASTSLAALNVTSSTQSTTETGAATVTLSPQILTASAQAPATAGKASVALSAIDLASSLPSVTPSGKASAALAVLSVSSVLRDATAAGALLATEGLGAPITGSNKFTAASSRTDDTLQGSAKNSTAIGSTRETISGSNRQVIVRRY